jgi:hypothetical protein
MEDMLFLVIGLCGLSLIAAAVLFLTRKAPSGAAWRGGGGDDQAAGAAARAHREHDDDEDIAALGLDLTDAEYDEVCALKEGGKKRKKLLAKIAKKRVRAGRRQEELAANEQRRTKLSAYDEKQRAREQEREEEEARREAAAAKAKAEEEAALQEQFDEWSGSFETTEQGAENEGGDTDSKLSAFVARIEQKKVVLLSDLSIEFGLSSQAAVDRVKQLEEDGTITGVIDDRGKFIYVSTDELKRIADMVRRRGRISVSELGREINSIVDLNPGEDEDGGEDGENEEEPVKIK